MFFDSSMSKKGALLSSVKRAPKREMTAADLGIMGEILTPHALPLFRVRFCINLFSFRPPFSFLFYHSFICFLVHRDRRSPKISASERKKRWRLSFPHYRTNKDLPTTPSISRNL